MPLFYTICFTLRCAFYQAKLINLEKTLNQKCPLVIPFFAHNTDRSRVLRVEIRMIWLLCYAVLHTVHAVFWNNLYQVWWVLYPGNIFLVDLYHETLGPGVSMGSYPFPFGINFILVSMRNPIFWVARDQASIPGVNRVLSPKKLWMFFVCQQKFSEKHNFFLIV